MCIYGNNVRQLSESWSACIPNIYVLRLKGRGNPRWMESSTRNLGVSGMRSHYSRPCWTPQKEYFEPVGNVCNERLPCSVAVDGRWTDQSKKSAELNLGQIQRSPIYVRFWFPSAAETLSLCPQQWRVFVLCACVRVFLCIVAPWLLGGVAQQQTKLQRQE
jgi:hypothetical protein